MKSKGCIVLIAWLLMISIAWVAACFMQRNDTEFKDSVSVDNSTEKIRLEGVRFLGLNKTKLLYAVEKIKSQNFEFPITFSFHGRNSYHLWALIDNESVDVSSRFASFRKDLIDNVFCNNLYGSCFESDSVIISFRGDWDDRLFFEICHSDRSFEDLRNYTYGMDVFSKNEVPDKNDSYFWEIEDNWYIYRQKELHYKLSDSSKTIEWAIENKECYFYEIRDTFKIVLDELHNLNLGNIRYSLSNIRGRGLFRIEYQDNKDLHTLDKSFYMYEKRVLLDSIFNGVCPFVVDHYSSGYYKFGLHFNHFLFYYYSELPQDSLQMKLHHKVNRLEKNWYYYIDD